MITPEELRNHASTAALFAETRLMLEAAADRIERERQQVRIGHIVNAACIIAFVVLWTVGTPQRCEAATPLKPAQLIRVCSSGNAFLVRHSGKLWLRTLGRPIHDVAVHHGDADRVCR